MENELKNLKIPEWLHTEFKSYAASNKKLLNAEAVVAIQQYLVSKGHQFKKTKNKK